jgi:hypothetical protein
MDLKWLIFKHARGNGLRFFIKIPFVFEIRLTYLGYSVTDGIRCQIGHRLPKKYRVDQSTMLIDP